MRPYLSFSIAPYVLIIMLFACATPEERAREAIVAGQAALTSGNRDQAIQHFAEAMKLAPELADGWTHLAET